MGNTSMENDLYPPAPEHDRNEDQRIALCKLTRLLRINADADYINELFCSLCEQHPDWIVKP